MEKKMRVQIALMRAWRPGMPDSDRARAWVDEGMAKRFGDIVDANANVLDESIAVLLQRLSPEEPEVQRAA